jgi:monofunctional biosynthetic peptidoglycan transglycosylase
MLRRLILGFLLATTIPVAVLRWIPPPASAFMLLEQASAIFQRDREFRLHYRWVPWDDISPAMKLAVVASEDQLFSEHLGFDLQAIGKALEHNQRGRRTRGASTISQQTAKNLFLYPGRSYFRKALEVYFTGLLELFWPKQRILEIYLNIAQFGKGIYGVAEAGRIYFGKSAERLSAPEAALLAAVLPNPAMLQVNPPSAYVERRRRWILQQMRQLGGEDYLDALSR